MISFTYEDNIAVNWDGDKTFNITRDRVIIDSFVEQETPTLEKANISRTSISKNRCKMKCFATLIQCKIKTTKWSFNFAVQTCLECNG